MPSFHTLLILVQAATSQPARLTALKQEAVRDVASRAQFTQQMVDQIFSFAELGFEETETSRYLVDLLRRNGFTVREGIAGIPTAWVATWGTGKPVISLGSDIDDIPQASQKPGVACHAPMIEGAPGHGEGHNSGQAVNITAALAVKRIMERERLPGTIQLWPGVSIYGSPIDRTTSSPTAAISPTSSRPRRPCGTICASSTTRTSRSCSHSRTPSRVRLR